MRLIIVAAFALATGAFAGCIGGVGTITAMDGLEAATEAAADLVSVTPQLVSVASLEPMSEYFDEDDDLEVHVHLDSKPGDGRSPGWIYTFVADDDLIVIGYASGLGILFEVRDGGEVDEGEADEHIISGWEIDSDEAAAALNAHEEWPDMTPSSNLFWELYQDEECPVWWVEHYDAEDEDDARWMRATVDACTGEVLELGPAEELVLVCGHSWTTGTSMVAPVVFTPVYSIDVDDGSYVHYVVDVGTGAGDVNYRIMGPGGVVAEGTNDVDETLDEVMGGQYTLEISSTVGARQVFALLEGGTCS